MEETIKEEKNDTPADEAMAAEAVNEAASAEQPGEAAQGADEVQEAAKEEESIAGAAAEERGARRSPPTTEAEALEAALAAEKDRNVRLYADFENFRRRMERERLETWGRAEREVLADLLPVIDNFDRAMTQAGDDPFAEGVKMVHAGLLDFLKKRGVEKIEAVGQAFDPAVHEAVAYQPSPEAAEGTIIYETRKGYRMGDGVLRPASVIVSSGKPGE